MASAYFPASLLPVFFFFKYSNSASVRNSAFPVFLPLCHSFCSFFPNPSPSFHLSSVSYRLISNDSLYKSMWYLRTLFNALLGTCLMLLDIVGGFFGCFSFPFLHLLPISLGLTTHSWGQGLLSFVSEFPMVSTYRLAINSCWTDWTEWDYSWIWIVDLNVIFGDCFMLLTLWLFPSIRWKWIVVRLHRKVV